MAISFIIWKVSTLTTNVGGHEAVTWDICYMKRKRHTLTNKIDYQEVCSLMTLPALPSEGNQNLNYMIFIVITIKLSTKKKKEDVTNEKFFI